MLWFFLVHKKQSFKCVILEEIINTSPSRSVALYACEWAQWRGIVKDSWEKNGLKILNKLIQNPTGRKPKQWDLFYPPVPLFWITCWPEVSWDVSTRASSKFNASPSEELGNSALKTNAFFAVCLICQLAAFLQSSGNTHQDSKRMPSLTRSHQCKWCMIHRCITYTDISHTNRCIIHKSITNKDVSYTESADKETRKTLIENKKHKKSQKHQRKRLVSVHNESLNSMLRGAFMPGSSQHLSHCEKDLAAFQITCEHFRGSHKTNSQRIFLFK